MNASAALTPDQITIAVTVFSRRQYLRQAVTSALEQTVPVRVMVVEDCGPDPEMESWVRSLFGSRVEYFRSPKRRGIFGNWNACIEQCPTRWLSILHDDDFLAPCFVEAMLDLSRKAPDCALYFGHTEIVDENGVPWPVSPISRIEAEWRRVKLEDVLYITPFPFPGQLFNVDDARALGGFRETSVYCGDWEMWTRLIAKRGAARTRRTVASNRQHQGWDRGTSVVVRSGKQYPASYVQHKRILALLRKQGTALPFDRRAYQARFQLPVRFLLRFGSALSRRLLAYHVGLLVLSPAPHLRYAAFQVAARWLGPGFVRWASRLANVVRCPPPA